jgi:hypothetical protein
LNACVRVFGALWAQLHIQLLDDGFFVHAERTR